MRNRRTLSGLSLAILLAQLLVEALTLAIIRQLDMLPGIYFGVVAVLLALLLLIVGLLLFIPGGKNGPGNGRRIAAMMLALLIVLGCAFGSAAVSQLYQTMGSMTDQTVVTTVMKVYVLTDDPAQTVAEAAGYTFGYLGTREAERAEQALRQFGISPEVDTSFTRPTALVDALYTGQVGAILMNSSFADTLAEGGDENYADFATRTRVLEEVRVDERINGSERRDDSGSRPIIGGESAEEKTAEIDEAAFLVYLSGSDTRETYLSTGRSDVNILAVVNPVTKQVLLVNTPRDYYVDNAALGMKDKLTHLGNNGITNSISGLEELYDERIDFYGQINFTGFEKLIDAIGGITVYFDTSFTARGVTPIEVGNNDLTGSQALDVARDRYSFADGDNARGRNQMKIIKAVIQKLASGTIITNYSQILDSLDGMFATDISMNDISKLVKMQLSDMASWNILSYAVTGEGGTDETSGGYAYVMYPDDGMVEFGRQLIDRVIAGEILTDADVVYQKAE